MIMVLVLCIGFASPISVAYAAESNADGQQIPLRIQIMKEQGQKGFVEQGSVRGVYGLLQKDCILIDLAWICNALGIVYEVKEGFIYLWKTEDSSLKFVLKVGASQAFATSPYLGQISVDLGGTVVEKEEIIYVPFTMFLNIFNSHVTFEKKDAITLWPCKTTVVDILHKKGLEDYYYDVTKDAGLTKNEIGFIVGYGTLYQKVKSLFQGIVGLDIQKVKQVMPSDMTPIAELIAQFLYTKSSDEVLKSWNETASIVTNLGLSSVDLIKDFAEKGAEEAYAEGLRLWEEKHQSMLASSGSANMDYYKEVETKMLKNLDDANIKYKNLSSFIKGSAAAVNVGMNAFFTYATLANEISEAEQFHIEAVKEYLKHYEDFENLYVEEKIVNTIEEKAQLYDQQEKNIFKNKELLTEIGKSVGNTITSIGIGEGIDITANQLVKRGLVSKAALKNFSTTLIQLQFVSIGWDVVEMAINENMGGALEASTALQASLYAMLLQNDAAMIRNQCTDFSNLDEYRKLEWMRLRSFYITRQLVLGFYEPQKLLHPEVYEIGMEPIKQDCEELVALMNVLESGPVGATQEVLDACATMRKEKDAELLNKVEEIVNGMVEKKVTYDEDGSIEYYYIYEYDSRGNEVKLIQYNWDASIGYYGIYQYDNQGNRVKVIWYNSDESIDYYYTYEYDGQGNRIKRIRYNSDGSRAWIWCYEDEYDSQGNQIKKIRYNSDGSVDEVQCYKKEYKYDKYGNPIKEIKYYSDSTMKGWYEYEYDNQGNLIKDTWYKVDVGKSFWHEYEYDEQRNLVKETEYFSKSGKGQCYEYEYDSQGNQVKSILYNSDGSMKLWYEYEYDSQGNQIMDIHYNADGSKGRCYKYEYDNQGNQIMDSYYNPDGSIYWWREYEYDRQGNQIKYKYYYESDGSISMAWSYTYEYIYRTFSLEKAVHIPAGAVEYNGHSYYVFSDICKSWEEAKSYCESLGGHLAVINNAKENKRVYEIMKEFGYSNAYFGFSDAEAEGKWKWVTEDTVTYTNWSSGEPNNQSKKEDYAMFYYKSPKYKWNDSNFGKGKKNNYPAFICEWDTTVDEKE